MLQRMSKKLFAAVAIYPMIALMLHFPLVGNLAFAQDGGVQIEFDPITAAIKGSDVSLHVRVNQDVDEVKVFIRQLLDLFSPFNDLPMEKTGATTWRILIPLSSEEGELGRLEYYVEAYKNGQPVAKTENFVISFIDPPFIGEVQKFETPGLDKAGWKDFVAGRIKRPFFKRWYVWAFLGAAGIAATAVLVGGSEEIPPGPPVVTFSIAENAVRDTNQQIPTNFLCERSEIPVKLNIVGGVPPFDVVFTAQITGGSAGAAANGISPDLDGSERVIVATQSFADSGEKDVLLPGIDVKVPAGSFGVTNILFSTIIKDGETIASIGGTATGSVVPSTTTDLITNDPRVQRQNVFDTIIAGIQTCPSL